MDTDRHDQLKSVSDPAVATLLRHIIEGLDALDVKLTNAFPSSDIDGHRRYHEEVIAMMQDRRRMRQAVLEQVIKGSAWALLITTGAALWTYIKDHIR
jgi:hypothetical protein